MSKVYSFAIHQRLIRERALCWIPEHCGYLKKDTVRKTTVKKKYMSLIGELKEETQ